MARTSQALLVVLATAALALAGCNNKVDADGELTAFGPPGGGTPAGGVTGLPADGSREPLGPPVDSIYRDSVPPTDPPPVPYDVVQPPPPAVRYHVVQPKENYYRIALQYYGSGSRANVQRLIDANPQYPPDKIPIGAKIVVPD